MHPIMIMALLMIAQGGTEETEIIQTNSPGILFNQLPHLRISNESHKMVTYFNISRLTHAINTYKHAVGCIYARISEYNDNDRKIETGSYRNALKTITNQLELDVVITHKT
uniref:Uncharacterized protein n=1 Tax=Trichogramma kaykai TaxID=54128 RepID=A0ABD2W5S8_9HYME